MTRTLLMYFANPLTGKSGLESDAIDFARAVSSLGTNVILACASGVDPLEQRTLDQLMLSAGIQVERIPLRFPFYLDASLSVAKTKLYLLGVPSFCLRSIATALRVVISRNVEHAAIWHSFIAFPVALALRLLGVRTVAYGHPLADVGVKRLFANWQKKKLMRVAGVVGGTTIRVFEALVLRTYSWFRASSSSQALDPQLRRFCKGRLGVIPPGVNVSEIPHIRDQDEGGIAYFGALEDWWDIESLIVAFAAVSEEFPQASLHIYGGGSRQAELRKLAAKLDSRGGIKMYGAIPRRELLTQFGKFGIVVVPLAYSPSNGSVPMKLIEAAAAGKAIIGTTVPGIPEYFTNRAILIPPRDTNAMIEALRTLLGNERIRRDLAAKAKAIAYLFDSRRVTGEFLDRVFEGRPAKNEIR